jgi:P pilus assembly chaperone PapD
MKPLITSSILTSLAFAVAATAFAGGPGDLLVAPTRAVLDRQTRTAEFTLMNKGDAPATYRIEITHVRMQEHGGFAPSDEPSSAFADAFVQFSPRRVVLQPRVTQTVRVRLRPPVAPVAAELYLHLVFRGEPSLPETGPDPGAKAMSLNLTPVYGVAVPVIVRFEETHAAVRIDGVRLDAAGAAAFQLVRSGNRSTYGDIAVTFTPRGGASREVAVVKGVSIYAPLAARSMTLPLRLPEGLALREGSLEVSYADAEGQGSPRETATLVLP